MKLTISIITAFLISAASLFSIVELEEVLQLYPDGGTLYGNSYSKNKVFLNGDTILVRTNLTALNNSYNLKLSTDRGITWQDITERMSNSIGDGFSNERYSELGSYYLTVNSKDTLIEYYNLDGELIRTASPANKSLRSVSIILNPLDENFVGYFYNYYDYLHHFHYHTFYTSIDRGEKWHYVSPKGGGGGSLSIEYTFSSANKSKLFFDYDWSNVYVASGGAYFSYDTYTNKIEYISNYKREVYCYECTGDNEYVFRKSGESDYTIVNMANKTERPFNLIRNTLGLDIDSIAQYDDEKNPNSRYERIWPTNRATNLRSPNHQLLELTHYKYDSDLYPEEFIFVHQYYFQTFDFGNSWELVYQNKDKDNLVQNFGINPKDNVFWVIKGEQDDSDYRSDTKKPILYKSKTPLTTVEDSYITDGMKVNIIDSKLTVISDEYQNKVSLRIFNLEGKELQSLNISLNKGLNELIINSSNEKLLFISIELEGENRQIYKLLNNN